MRLRSSDLAQQQDRHLLSKLALKGNAGFGRRAHPVIEQAFHITGRVKKPGVAQAAGHAQQDAPKHGVEAGPQPKHEQRHQGQVDAQRNLEHHNDADHHTWPLGDVRDHGV